MIRALTTAAWGVLIFLATCIPWALRRNRHERLPGEFLEP